ncbi:hypothetical protein M2189_002737 [Bradyrhizobium japonicum]|uniref:hypothetical protein n=1 Tax=Bradyrhizobium japonicum TaxID=375 RepID=UPI0021671AD1|nr:hypothetical protein [Bradyrhizobium japonicum]MCS3498305.1 hypothetical protein [Bradyrhizobium japonicum]MCS3959534.1 hypothetical protein [Bradyrhizobium japonicum]MCS4001288.1 hypothetical protein [Bradyrhizobium japonicum]
MIAPDHSGPGGMIDRIRAIAVEGLPHPDGGSLLHAYIACLSVSELCLAITATLDAPLKLRLALRRRLLRLLRDDQLNESDRKRVRDLIERSRATGLDNPASRRVIEALLSATFEFLPRPQQQSIIENWMDRGTRGAAARWLKAVAQVPALFDEAAVMAYFRSSYDERAARRLANQASPAYLAEILPELADNCEEGWIVSRAAMRAQTVDEAVWPIIRSKHPATYLYLCARRGRGVSEAEALELVMNCPNSIMNATRGLAIWAVGQMGMIRVLDEIVARGEELHRRDLEEFDRFPG